MSVLGLTRDKRSNITLCRQELPWASPSRAPSGKGLYLTVYPSSRPNTDTISALMWIFINNKDKIIFHLGNQEGKEDKA